MRVKYEAAALRRLALDRANERGRYSGGIEVTNRSETVVEIIWVDPWPSDLPKVCAKCDFSVNSTWPEYWCIIGVANWVETHNGEYFGYWCPTDKCPGPGKYKLVRLGGND